jgi:hypothetical protein
MRRSGWDINLVRADYPLTIVAVKRQPTASGKRWRSPTSKMGRDLVVAVGDRAAKGSVREGRSEKPSFGRALRLVARVAVSVVFAAIFIAPVAPSAYAVPFTLTVSLEGTGSGTVTSSPAGVNCPSDCSESYEQGTVVDLFAAPSEDSKFAGWSGGGCAGLEDTCSTTVTADTSVTVVFDGLEASTPTPLPTDEAPSPEPNGDGDAPSDPVQRTIDRRIRALAEGGIAFLVPLNMKVGTESSVTVRISRDPSEDLFEGVDIPGEPEPVLAAPVMAVELIGGSAFEVSPEGPQEQVVPPNGFSEWSWFVLPQEAGDQTLRFVVSIVIQLPSGTEKSHRIVKNREIHVSVNPGYQVGQFLLSYWPVIGGILGLLFGGGIALRRGRKRRSDSPGNGGM